MTTVYLPREAWGADPKHPPLGYDVPWPERSEIAVHHTVMLDSDDTPNVWEDICDVVRNMRRLQTIRWAPGKPGNLGPDVPYNFVVYLGATIFVCEGRGWDRTGAHTPGHNTTAIGVAFAGNFETDPPEGLSEMLREVASWLHVEWKRGFGGQGFEIFGHRDTKATACPGKHLYDRLDALRLV